MKRPPLTLCTGLMAAALSMATTTLPAVAGPVPGQGTWESTLHARDIDGNGSTDAFYDSALGITWMANWGATGAMLFSDAAQWASTLTIGGLGGWRLPTMVDTGAPGCDLSAAGGTDCGYNTTVTGSELGHLFYETLGNLSYYAPGADFGDAAQAGWGLSNTALFSGMQSTYYWTGTDYALAPALAAWTFRFDGGWQGAVGKDAPIVWATAVRDGDVGTAQVPEPRSIALVCLGLLGVAAMRATDASRHRRSGSASSGATVSRLRRGWHRPTSRRTPADASRIRAHRTDRLTLTLPPTGERP